MTHSQERTFGNYHIGSSVPLDAGALETLCAMVEHPTEMGEGLSGRATVTRGILPGIGSVVVKHYTRGGLFGRIVRRRYLHRGPTRAQQEFELLQRVRSLGLHAPEPIAHVWQGKLFYRAWLATREIESERNLAELSRHDEKGASDAILRLSTQVGKLIEHGIWHVDLHPGNVLVDRSGEVFLIDFDKAQDFRGTARQLRDRYMLRWRRAAIKHNLPDIVSEAMCLQLRRTL